MKLFTPIHNFITRHSTYILVTIIVIFAGGSMIMTAAESAATRQAAVSAKSIASDTKAIVESQGTILTAIKQAEQDNSLTAAQKTNIIICMLQVPQPERIPKESDCRKQALTSSDTSDKTSQGTSGVGPKVSGGASSSNSAPKSAPTQPNNPQAGNAGSGQQNNPQPLLTIPNTCAQLGQLKIC